MATKHADKQKRWRLVGYVVWFQVVFCIMLYWTFPIKTFQGQAQQHLQNALSQAMGKQVKVAIGSMSLWRLSGLQLRQVRVQIPPSEGKPAAKVDLDRIKARLVLFSSLVGDNTFAWQTSLQGQSLAGSVSVNNKGSVSFFSLDIPRMQLDKLAVLSAVTGLPAKGELQAAARLQVGDGSKTLKGSFNLSWQKAAVGPGNLVLPAALGLGDTLQVPAVQLGGVAIQANAQQGKAQLQKLQFAGGDVQINVTGEGKLRKSWRRSALSGKGWFRLSPDFLKKNPGLQALLGVSPQLRRAKDDQGRYAFSLRGSVRRPQFSLGKG
ncbi:MAG: type II secretion system protein GspN [Myxococcota bacterium]